MSCLEFQSPLGVIKLSEENGVLTGLNFQDRPGLSEKIRRTPVLQAAERQLEEYFSGTRIEFDLPLALKGTLFQSEVWEALRTVSFGRTISYGDLAKMIGRPSAVRAVGAANGANPVPIIVPCHRIIGSDGRLTGYGGGLWRKEWLLAHERMSGRRRSIGC
jgi:methylated-DNA-[protein]-cysteine S-methyltransferase